MQENKQMVYKKEWEEFRKAGLLWFINSILHAFGWAICVEVDDGVIINAYPSRVKFRGFSEEKTTEGYIKLSKFMKENADTLLREAEED